MKKLIISLLTVGTIGGLGYVVYSLFFKKEDNVDVIEF